MKMNIYHKILEQNRQNVPFAIATIVKTEGSVPGKVGFKILVDHSGKTTGTVGGGALEKQVIQECLSRLKSGNSGLQEYKLQDKISANDKGPVPIIPMMCNGKVWIYYEINSKLTEIYIFGGGHIGQVLCYYLSKLNYKIILIDNRREFTDKEKNPFAHELIHADYINYVEEFTPSKDAFVVIVTHGHNFDLEILQTIYQRKLNLRYIGVIASRSKSGKLKKKLREKFGPKADFTKLYTPIGIDIGGDTESQIALSIAAEIQAIAFQKTVPHLRDKNI